MLELILGRQDSLPNDPPGRSAHRFPDKNQPCGTLEASPEHLADPLVPFTNNEAKQDFRMGKLRLKISGGFRLIQDARDFANLRSVIATTRKQGWNVVETLACPDPLQLAPKLRP